MSTLKGRVPYGDVVGAAITLAACFLLLWDPEDAIAGGLQGLRIFGEIVLPSLLPFFIVSEILIGLGLVHFIGALVEPLMRPVFNVPGTGSFVWSMGLAAGYPMDAVITAKLRNAGDCTRIEGERLLAFTNTADPLFLLGAVAVGMLGLPALGFHLAVSHYLSALLVGLIFRFYGRDSEERSNIAPQKTVKPNGYWGNAVSELKRARRSDGRDFGRLMADAMADSTQSLLKVAGFIMFFAALIRLMDTTGFIHIIGTPVSGLFGFLGWSTELTPGLVAGALELDVGSAMVAEASAPLIQRLAVISAIIGWSGLSVHGQVASIVCTTDLRLSSYVKARLLHGLLAGIIAMVLLWLRPITVATSAGSLTTFAFFPLFRVGLASGIMGLAVVGGYLCYRFTVNK